MINEKLKKLRNSKKLTQEWVAERLNVSRQSVAKWESGETMPDINKCKELAKLYEVTLDELVNYITDINKEEIAPDGKYIFGIAKVGERGQIVIPKKARNIFNISAGDEVLILGDTNKGGMALVKLDNYSEFANEIMNIRENMEDEHEGD